MAGVKKKKKERKKERNYQQTNLVQKTSTP
jgi:hypothetical protein